MCYKKQNARIKRQKARSNLVSRFLLLVSCLLSLVSCKQIAVYEKDSPIPNYEWQSGLIIKGSFSIPDTSTAYKIYLVLRHTDAYKYNNIWLNIGLQAPGDTMSYQKINLRLGQDATGWDGTGMNDIWEVRKALSNDPVRFKRSGDYQFQISQIMRDNPLRNIMSAGLRVEKQPH
jgi:gliding motility-associated lipoprotein GldH